MKKGAGIEADLLKEMFKKRIIGKGYKPLWKIMRFFPPFIRGNIKKTIKKLVTKGILLSFKSGNCVSINHKNLAQVFKIIEGEI